MRPLISILVPAYQAEKTIRRCLESIMCQTSDDYEVIVINDGSKDETLSICNEFAVSDRIRIISQENIGIAGTRRKLLEYASGDYIQYVDADDWIEPNTVEILKACVDTQRYDIVISDFFAEYCNSTEYISQRPSGCDGSSHIKDLSSSRMMGVLWNKLMKRELLSSIVIPSLSYCEDWVVSMQLFERAKSVFYMNNAFYHYDNSFIGNSLTRNISKETFKARIEYLEHLKSLDFDKKYPKEFNSQASSIAYTAIVHKIYDRRDFRMIFGGVSLTDSYISLYKKMILLSSRIVSISFARVVDCMIRKILKKGIMYK